MAKTFKCIFCNHEDAVACSLDFHSKVGELNCRVCGEYNTGICVFDFENGYHLLFVF